MPDPRTVKSWIICPGLWIDKHDRVHLDSHAVCAARGFEPSDLNCETIERQLVAVLKETGRAGLFYAKQYDRHA